MLEGWLSKPVQIAVGIVGDVRHVTSERQAVDMPTHHWPTSGTPTYDDARRACLSAVNGNGPADTARESLVAAAREARVLIE